MTNLTNILSQETQSLKTQYIEFTKDWAKSDFFEKTQWLKEYYLFMDTKYKNKEYMKEHGVYFNPEYRNEYLSNYRDTFDKMPKEILLGDVDAYIKKQIEKSEKHYESSIIKLANKIQQ